MRELNEGYDGECVDAFVAVTQLKLDKKTELKERNTVAAEEEEYFKKQELTQDFLFIIKK